MKEVIGCFTTSGIFIATGEVVSMDGSDVRCIENGNTYVIVMSPAKHDTLCKDSEGREWEEGSEWKEESVLYRCGKEGRKRVMGCITISGVLIRKGEVKSVDGSDFECMKHANGSITMRMLGRSIMKCKDREGREWEEGSEWKEGSVQYKCGKEGVKELMGCITTSGVLIRKGEVKSVDGSDIECRKHANGFITMQVLAKYECKGINGRWRKLGEIWRERQRIEGEYRCDKGGVRTVLGCIAGGKYIPIHSQTHIWGAYHLCTSDAYGANLERQCKCN
uniref:Abnormal cell migration protein 18-like fibronectin type I domain-containing protein n=1 Tax=Angiostrongylus cantonensis TaxID=6313 RepID=A0A0K0D566_ANGCA